ncbi:hypothetical protein H1230_04040 [Paenibacillus sp. 19GGS1-52]|uniref:hypothetical protein n=1 Tax=Paenibacillus sp. 19GGS1-52 TaxID=2758563 RepID=UPI001EFA8267|nr:hypothetical protein [Paenibacillus sp. 19GGS1-52]ULO08040.1 hypothetical protein H1230_04040 [Paenibacillus sp. 19GGS1-52]
MLFIIILFLFFLTISSAYGSLFKILIEKGYISNIQGICFLYPFFGFSILSGISQFFGIFIGAKFFNPFIIIGGIIIMLMRFFKYRFKNELVMGKVAKLNTINIFIFGVIFLIYLFPSIYVGFPTSFASINNDLIFYLSIPEWLIDKGYFSTAISDNLHPFFSIAELHFSRFSRVGADYFNTLAMTFFNTDAVHTFNEISCFFVLLFSLSVFYTCKYSFQLSNWIVLTAVALSTVNTLLFWMFTTQYMPQIGGNAFYVLSAGFIYQIIHEKKIHLVIPTSLCISGLIAIYSEYTLYLLIPTMIFLGISILKDFKNTKIYMKILLYTFLITALLNPTSTFLAIKYNIFAYTTTQNAIGIVEYIPFFNQILMVFGIKTLDYAIPPLLPTFVGLLLLGFVLLGLFKVKRGLREYLCVYFSFIIILLLYLNFINKFPYGYYKTLMFAQPFVIVLFSIGVNSFKLKYNYFRYFTYGALVIILLSNLLQIGKLENIILNKGLLVTKEYTEMREINKLIPENEVLSIEDVTKDEQHILAFFLKETKISYKNPNSYFTPYTVPELQSIYTLKGSQDILNYNNALIWHNEKFRLYKNFNISMIEGWHGLEDWNGVPTRWTKSEFILSAKSLNTSEFFISFNPIFPPNVTERTIQIYINDKLIEEKKIKNNKVFTTSKLKIELNIINNIKFVVKEGTVRVGQDTRELGIALQNVEIIN